MAKPKAKIIKKSPAERVTGNLKRTAYSSIVESIALVILGILFIILPDTIIKVLAYIIGAFFIIKGGYAIIGYYMSGGQKDSFDSDLFSGVISVLIGIAALLIGENIAGVFRVIIGIIVIYESLIRINASAKLHSAGVDSWRYVLGLALIMLVLGIFITFNSGAVVSLIGGIMIVIGIIGIIGDVMFMKHVNTVVDYLNKVHNAVTGESPKK